MEAEVALFELELQGDLPGSGGITPIKVQVESKKIKIGMVSPELTVGFNRAASFPITLLD